MTVTLKKHGISSKRMKELEKDAKACCKSGAMWDDLENTKLKMNAIELDKWLTIYATIKFGK